MTITPIPDYKHTLTQALSYLDAEAVDVPASLRLKVRRMAGKAGYSDMTAVTARYNNDIVAALTTYFEGGAVTAPRNQFRAAMVEAFNSAFDTGWTDGGGGQPIDAEAIAWLQAEVERESANIASLFEQAKVMRTEPDVDFFSWVTARADGYTGAVYAIYNAAVMWAKQGQLGEWHLGNTEKHCDSCLSLDGTKHRASWYIAHNYIPRKPGASMDCGGYHCDCRITGKDGSEWTL